MLAVLIFVFFANSDHLASGDIAFEHERYEDAIQCYQASLHDDGESSEALWKIARSIVCQADVAPLAEQQDAYHKAMDSAERSIKLNPHSSNAHTWFAIALGYVAIGEGVRSQIKIAYQIKAEVEEAIRLDPRNDVAYSIEGTLFRSLGNVGWIERQLAAVLIGRLPDGGYNESEQALRKAITLAPNVIRHRYELGLLYIDWGKKDEAKKIFLDAVPLKPAISSDRIRIVDMQKRLQQM
jgi:tetratricopeptide (TPR) repeat protein